MFVRMLAAVAALNLVALPSLSAMASESSPPACALHAHRVTAVEAYRAPKRIGKARIDQVRGAVLYVEAQRGVTAEWLELDLKRHLAAMRGPANMPDCPFDLDGARVNVKSQGAGFLVTIAAQDSSAGKEVLRRARLLLG